MLQFLINILSRWFSFVVFDFGVLVGDLGRCSHEEFVCDFEENMIKVIRNSGNWDLKPAIYAQNGFSFGSFADSPDSGKVVPGPQPPTPLHWCHGAG